MPADEVTHGTDVDESRVRTGPRHAAPKKPLFTRFHMPAGKAIASVAMPTAVLMGFGFTSTLAIADTNSTSSASSKSLAEDYKDCVAALDSASPSASASASDDATDSATPSATASDDAKDSTSSSDKSSSSDSGSDDTATPTPSASKSSSSSGDSGSSDSGSTATPSPSASESSSSGGGLLDSIGDAIGSILSGGSTTSSSSSDSTASATPSPSASASSDSSSSSTEKSDSSASTSDDSGSDTVSKTVKTVTDTVKDTTDTATKAADDATKAAADATSSASPSASASSTTSADDCEVATDDVSGVDNKVPVADDPWYLSASSLTLKSADYQGIVTVKTASGKTKKVLKYVISGGTDIGNLHQTVKDTNIDKTYHVQAASGSTSTIRDGSTTMYTESISGNLFGLIPITFDVDNPPPLNIPLIYFTNVKVTQAAQFGGTLHIPGMHVYTTDGTG
ncbi:hypothetical protein ACFWPQ_45695 [Streptomyces sp. NPDC058464]|uniref:hypothetical protein n=1 Tax=Streptomyces sp. NPDC058464 TaxID=3346511 RepID=UPI00365ECA5E